MIRGILFALFFILLGVGAGLAVFFGYKHSKSHIDVNEKAREIRGSWNLTDDQKKVKLEALKNYKPKNGFFKAMIASIAVSIASLGLVICIPGSFHQVEAGTYAVVKRVGKIVDVKSPGTYFDFYMTKKYEIYDATVQQVKINTSSYSSDGQTMDLEVYLQYQIQLDNLIIKDSNGNILQTEGIAGKFGSLASLQTRIEAQCIEKTKAVMSSAEAMKIIQNRAEYSTKVSEEVTKAIGTGYYVNVQDVVLTNIDFTDEFEKSVEAKVVAEQQKQASITKAEAELEVARIEADKKIAEAKGQAEAQKIIAQATAEAATYKIIELARVVGYEVNETYIYSVNGLEKEFTEKQVEVLEGENTIIYLGTKYVIDIKHMADGSEVPCGEGESAADTFNKLVESYLQYLAYLEEWNGELPQVVAGDDAISIIVPNN